MATKIKNEYTDFLDSVLYYKGRGANNGDWNSWKEKGTRTDNYITFTKPHSYKTGGHALVRYYYNEYPELYSGHEFKIEMWINSYCEWYDVFEGWVDSIDELKTIFKCVGIPLNLKENG